MSEFEKAPSNPSSSCLQNQTSPSNQTRQINTGYTVTEEEKGDREKKRIAELVGQLEAMSEYVKERGGRPLPDEVRKARSLVTKLAHLGVQPRKMGLSPRQLGLNAKAGRSRKRKPTATPDDLQKWQDMARACIAHPLSNWELEFIGRVDKALGHGWGLSEKQVFYLHQIHDKVSGHG